MINRRQIVNSSSPRLAALLGSAALALATPAQAASTERVSVGERGIQANASSSSPQLSANGRVVVFESVANNLTPNDGVQTQDGLYVRDLKKRTTRRVSLGVGPNPADPSRNGTGYSGSISADGRFVAFASETSNLVPGDTNGMLDVFIRDLKTNAIRRVDLLPDDSQGPRAGGWLSTDARSLVVLTEADGLVPGDTDGQADIFVHTLATGATAQASGGTGPAGTATVPTISADGRFVAFGSYAPDLVPGDTDGELDLFVRDMKTGQLRWVSAGLGGAPSNGLDYSDQISGDGRFVVFESSSTNLVPGDTNGRNDAFVRDLKKGTTRLVSVARNGGPGDGYSGKPSVSKNGRFIAFESAATNLVAGDSRDPEDADVFVRDMQKGTTRLASVGRNGAQADGGSPVISADGSTVAFSSYASTLVPGDTNGQPDIFVRRF